MAVVQFRRLFIRVHDNVDETAGARLDGLERIIDAGERIGPGDDLSEIQRSNPDHLRHLLGFPGRRVQPGNRLRHAAGTLPIETGAAYNVVRRPTVFHAVNPERSARNERAVMRADAHTTTRKP
jgi:hypothetical protein